MGLVNDINQLTEDEEIIAGRFKAYNAKKAEYNELSNKFKNLDMVEENYANLVNLSKDQERAEELYLELIYEYEELEEIATTFNNKRSAIVNGQ